MPVEEGGGVKGGSDMVGGGAPVGVVAGFDLTDDTNVIGVVGEISNQEIVPDIPAKSEVQNGAKNGDVKQPADVNKKVSHISG